MPIHNLHLALSRLRFIAPSGAKTVTPKIYSPFFDKEFQEKRTAPKTTWRDPFMASAIRRNIFALEPLDDSRRRDTQRRNCGDKPKL
jgi:hypothetical protein